MNILLPLALLATVASAQDTIVVSAGAPGWGTGVRVARELYIGELDGPEEYSFAYIGGIAIGGDGAMYVLERKPQTVRKYDANGKFVKAIGREGRGPGELQSAEALSISGNRLIVRDGRNRRLNVYSLADGALEHWPYQTNSASMSPMTVHPDGAVSVPTAISTAAGVFSQVVFRYNANGSMRDTIDAPRLPYTSPQLEVRSGGGTARYSIPFAISPVWTYTPDRMFIGGLPDRYAILVIGNGKIRRIERNVPPVRLLPQERADAQTAIVANIRRNNDPAFSWDGAGMPVNKPFYGPIVVDADNRFWVRVATPSVRYPAETANGSATYRSPTAYDVYDSSLRFLGTLRFSDSFTLHQARGTQIWGSELNTDGVPVVVRYRRQ